MDAARALKLKCSVGGGGENLTCEVGGDTEKKLTCEVGGKSRVCKRHMDGEKLTYKSEGVEMSCDGVFMRKD